jgi:TetR/AcrR family transcriptional repressor of nem operon
MQPDTRLQLLTEAELVVRRVGYAGFSYADLAERVGIRKPSIHHHFPTKEDLGAALVEAYTNRFTQELSDITDKTQSALERLDLYAGLYRTGLQAGQGCLCGVLASELAGLPERVRVGVRRFFEVNAEWLAMVIADGQATHLVRSDVDARSQAAAVLAGLEGAMLVGRALGSVDAFDAAVVAIQVGLRSRNR